jgi:hypothetical protein
MPADLFPDEVIKKVAEQIDCQAMLRVLQAVRREGSIQNSGLDRETVDVLQRLTALGLVDPGYSGPIDGPPFLWVINSNGDRVLRYFTGIRSGPHYEISSAELAVWLERQGKDRWWNVDGDPLLTGLLTFPCPAEELAAELRRINRHLLVQAKRDDAGAKGQVIDAATLDKAVGRFSENMQVSGAMPEWAADRFLYLCWKRSTHEWLLAEDSVTTEQSRADEGAQSK